MFKLTIQTKNEAFSHSPIAEVIMILHEAIKKLERGDEEAVLLDYNGNKVGNYKLTRR